MRHFFLIFMITLLPVRGWIGDAMATGMVDTQVRQQTAAKVGALHAHEAGVQSHLDAEEVVPDTVQAVADCSAHVFGAELHAAATHCESCSVCHACHTVVLSATATDVTAVFNLSMLPCEAVTQFSSAETVLGEKTPIS